ncbi:hypothetical protein QJQ45_025239, partial [Haematococcus lacustris]
CSCLALLLFMARKKRRTGVGGPRAVLEDPDFDIVDRDEAVRRPQHGVGRLDGVNETYNRTRFRRIAHLGRRTLSYETALLQGRFKATMGGKRPSKKKRQQLQKLNASPKAGFKCCPSGLKAQMKKAQNDAMVLRAQVEQLHQQLKAGQPDLTEAQRKRKASGEARAARSRGNTFHARKAKLAHLTDHLPQALWDAFLDKAVRPRVKAQPGQPGQEWVEIPDKPLLLKWQRKLQQ